MKNSVHVLDALTMALMDLCVTAVLIALHLINALYDWPNPFVTVTAPLAAAVFFVLTAVWCLEAVRRAGARSSGKPTTALQTIGLHQPRPVFLDRRLELQNWRRFARSALGR